MKASDVQKALKAVRSAGSQRRAAPLLSKAALRRLGLELVPPQADDDEDKDEDEEAKS